MRREGWPTLLLYWVFWRLNRGPQGGADPQLSVMRVGDLDRVIERRRRAVLRRCTAAVDREGDAVNKAGVIAREENDRCGKFLGSSYPSCWCLGCELIHHLVGHSLHGPSARRAGGDGIDPDTTWAVLGSPGLRQQFQRCAARAVQSHAGLSK